MKLKTLKLACALAACCAALSGHALAAVLPNTTANGVAYMTIDRGAWSTIAPSEAYTNISGVPTGVTGPTADATGQRWMFADRFEGKAWKGAAYPTDYLTGATAPLTQPANGFALEVNQYNSTAAAANGFHANYKLTDYNSTSKPNGFIGLGGSFRATSDFNEPGASVWWQYLAIQQDATDSTWKIVSTRGAGAGSVFELTNVTTETIDGNLHLSADYVFGNSDWYQFFQSSTAAVISPTTVLGHIEIVPSAVPEPASLGLIGVGGLALLSRRRK